MWRWLKALTNRTNAANPPVPSPPSEFYLDAAARMRWMLLFRRGNFWGYEPPDTAFDPDSLVRSPRRFGPSGRTASAEVAEPEDQGSVAAVGRRAIP